MGERKRVLGGLIRRGGVLVAVALIAGVLVPGASPTKAIEPECTNLVALDCIHDLEWMKTLEQKIVDNTWDGQVYEIDYRTPLRTPGDVAGVGAFADSALWTGTYLASQSFRYATAKSKLADPLINLNLGEKGFWTAQKAQARGRIRDMLRKFNILINISKYWDHELDPQIKPFGFGGGIIHGEPGYLMRACIDRATIDANPTGAVDPGEDPTKPDFYGWSTQELTPNSEGLPAPYTNKRRVFGPFRWPNPDSPTEYFCEDGTSRDAYAGTIFGLLVAFDLYSSDDPALRTQIRNDIVTLSNFAFKYLWNTPRPHGRVSIPINSNHDSSQCSMINQLIDICGHDFENFFSPLFVITPTAQMEMTQAAHHVTTKWPGHPDTLKWQVIFAEELVALTPFLAFSELFDSTDPYGSYYKWNLEHLIAYNLVRQAPNEAARAIYKQAFGVMDASTGNDVNAHFETITYSMTGEQRRLVDAIRHLREWRDYRKKIEAGGTFDNSAICSVPDACVPQDQVDVTLTPGTPPIVVPGVESSLRAHYPLPVKDRTPTDFLWQRPPNQLVGSEGPTHQAPGIDYLLPYWMIRYLTEVNAPAPPFASPFPPYPGPSFN